jgi:hypothetical protein
MSTPAHKNTAPVRVHRHLEKPGPDGKTAELVGEIELDLGEQHEKSDHAKGLAKQAAADHLGVPVREILVSRAADERGGFIAYHEPASAGRPVEAVFGASA